MHKKVPWTNLKKTSKHGGLLVLMFWGVFSTNPFSNKDASRKELTTTFLRMSNE